MITQELKDNFNKVIAHSQFGIEDPKTDELLSQWADNKRWMYDTFMKKSLIRNFGKVSIELNEVQQEERFLSFLSYLYDDEYSLGQFLDHVGYKGFFDNSVSEPYEIIPGKFILAGAKVIKSFKYFITDNDRLRHLQDKASEYIQERYFEGELCFSIHPLDFLSSSENTLKWRSCHSLDGEYRAGNLSYIGDGVTFMTYIKTPKDTILPHFPEDMPWNNKKWRCLFFLHRDGMKVNAMFAGRPYPMELPNALDLIRAKLIKVFDYTTSLFRKEDTWTEWSNERITEIPLASGEIYHTKDEYLPIGGLFLSIYSFIKDAPESRHFNDLTRSSCYEPYYCWRKGSYWGFKASDFMEVGSTVKCLRCGEEIITTMDTMMCKHCECEYGNSDEDEYLPCEICGHRTHDSDRYYIDDVEICENCIETETFWCKRCGERHLRRNYWKDEICIFCKEEDE